MSIGAGGGKQTDAQDARVCACLEKILLNPLFAQSERLQRFLKFVVTETLAGRTYRLKGYTIGLEVFDRQSDFDPTIDAIVRVEAARLRAKLREYYDGEGQADPVRIELPKGSYTPVIQCRTATATEIPPPLRDTPLLQRGGEVDLRYPPPIEDKPSIAVLPFTNMSGDQEQGYFADGITDCLITELSRLPGLFVISRHSSFVYKGVSKNTGEIGRELGVKYLLEGGVQRAGNHMRITAQLIEAANGAHVWAERYDRELKDIFEIQDDVIRRILAVLQVKLAGQEVGHRGHEGTCSLGAHDCLLRGLECFWVYSRESTEEARRHFARAVELDPTYAIAHAWLARALVFQWSQRWDPDPNLLERALEHARKAVELNPQLPFAYSILCWVQTWRKQGEAAIAAGWRAVALDPNNADAHLFLSFALAVANRAEEALHYIEQGIRLNPHPSAFYQLVLGLCYLVLEEYEQAVTIFKRGIALRDVFAPNHIWLCVAYAALGRDEEARIERDKVLAILPDRIPMGQDVWLDKDLSLRMNALRRLTGLP